MRLRPEAAMNVVDVAIALAVVAIGDIPRIWVHPRSDLGALLRGHHRYRSRAAQAAHTLLREGQAVANYMPDRKALSAVRTPTRLLTGDTSPPPFGAAAREAAESIPGADLVTLPG